MKCFDGQSNQQTSILVYFYYYDSIFKYTNVYRQRSHPIYYIKSLKRSLIASNFIKAKKKKEETLRIYILGLMYWSKNTLRHIHILNGQIKINKTFISHDLFCFIYHPLHRMKWKCIPQNLSTSYIVKSGIILSMNDGPKIKLTIFQWKFSHLNKAEIILGVFFYFWDSVNCAPFFISLRCTTEMDSVIFCENLFFFFICF